MKMKGNLFILIGVCLLVGIVLSGCTSLASGKPLPVNVSGQALNHLTEMIHTSEEIYDMAQEGKLLDVKVQLQKLEILASTFSFSGVTSLEGFHALSESIIEAKRVFNAVQFSQDKGIAAAARIHLALDAMTHPVQPMWLQYYKVLIKDLGEIKSASLIKQAEQSRQAASRMYEHYTIIRPSIMINRDDITVEQIDSLFTFVKTQLNRKQIDYARIDSAINQFYELWDQVFMKKTKQAYVSLTNKYEIIARTIGLASVILLVLVYVGWRKYQVQRDYMTVRKQRKGDPEQ
ncbi:MAG TPA: sporulation protein YpjB [Bacilli bacterium]